MPSEDTARQNFGTNGRYCSRCSSPAQQVDNSGQLDLVLFSFRAPVNTISFTVMPPGN